MKQKVFFQAIWSIPFLHVLNGIAFKPVQSIDSSVATAAGNILNLTTQMGFSGSLLSMETGSTDRPRRILIQWNMANALSFGMIGSRGQSTMQSPLGFRTDFITKGQLPVFLIQNFCFSTFSPTLA